MSSRIGVIALVALSAACSPITNDTVADPAAMLDENVFKCSVQPILAKYCSYNACHGIAGTTGAGAALRVYTPGKLRSPPAADFNALVAPLTADEQHANFESAAGFSWNLRSVDDNFLLRKPLPSSAGGYEHQGGPIWSGTDDPNYIAIHQWLAGQGKCP
jgi:hypothetical protein